MLTQPRERSARPPTASPIRYGPKPRLSVRGRCRRSEAKARKCWVQCRPVFGATIVRRIDLLTSNNADLSTRKTADANGHQMGVGGTTLVERLESDASGSLTNWVVVSERTVDEDGWHSWSRLSGVPSDALRRPSDLYRFEGSSFSTDLLGETPTTPEPSTWVMMLIGFAGLGLAGYRSSRTSCHPIPIS
jgi:PEP-CTERM motif